MGERLPLRNTVSGQLLYLGARPLHTRHGEFLAHVAQNLATGAVAFAVTRGDFRSAEPLLARVHSSCVTSETFGGCDCDCVEQLDAALAQIAAVGRGVVFYLLQEGRGAGLVAKARDRMIVQASGHRVTTFEAYTRMGLDPDLRRYDEVGSLCRLLEVRAPLTILTNNAEKLASLAAQAGVDIAGSEVLTRPASPWNQHYIRSKYRSGHQLEDPSDQARASLPEPVVAFEPHPLPEDPRFIVMASYFLPIRPVEGEVGVEPVWFRMHAYFDLASGAERVVLSYGDSDEPTPLVRIQRESLLERFPLADGGANKRLWHSAVRQMIEGGAGIATFVSPDGFDAGLREMPGDPAACARLLTHHLRGRPRRPIAFRDEPDPVVLEPFGDVIAHGGEALHAQAGSSVLAHVDEPGHAHAGDSGEPVLAPQANGARGGNGSAREPLS